ncbi:MAG: hypothetical protein HWQ38_08140 [Nostoc sp. NMS7]|uniref:hypothetical protein n=1 Tax=Nostoc sp. NMS7 TaxID=2815391 RepID=UPI0025D89BAE|nr:hypothetical protein [Nostoc sp. NMS7]MBN3946452.1 hypothetical protein [Nostoc sp. NMS7]
MSLTAYLESKKLTLDAIKCKEGKPCGKICIPKKSKCAVGSSLKSPGVQANHTGRIIAGLGIGGALGTATVAAGLGVLGAAKLQDIRKKYQENFATSALRAKNESKNIKAPHLGADTKTAILTVGGFGTKDAYSESEVLKKNIESLGVKGLYIEPQSYAEFNVPTRPVDRVTTRQSANEARNLFIKTVAKTGYNPTAVKVAAKVIAYKKANPDKEYHLVGHSGGGLVVQEAHEILDKAGIKIKTTAIGSPDVGLIPGTGDLVTTTSSHDKILKLSGGRGVNGKSFNNVLDHGQNSYFADNDFRDFIKNRITPEEGRRSKADGRREDEKGRRSEVEGRRIDSDSSPSAFTKLDKAICKVGKNCGDICIPQKFICKAEGKSGGKLQTGSPNRLAVTTGLAMGAAIVGIPAAAYGVQKVRFQMGFPKSAELAMQQAKTYQALDKPFAGFRSIDDQQLPGSKIKSGVENINLNKPAKQITFFVGGIGAINGLEGDHMGQQISKMLPDHHVVAIEAPEQDVSFSKGDVVTSPRFIRKTVSALLKDNITKGRSEIAVRTAARAYAYHQKNPHLPINLIGQSGGGMPIRESAEILKRMGVKDVRVAVAGSPYFGLTSPTGISLIDPHHDPTEKIYGKTMPNKIPVEVTGHSSYFSEIPYKVPENGVWNQQVSKSIWSDAVPNKSVQKVLVSHFDREGKRINSDSSPLLPSNTLQQIQRQFSILLSRSYGKAIARIGGIKISLDNTVTGMAQDNLGKILNFTFKDGKLSYELSKKTAKLDSSELANGLIANYRLDKSFVKKKCGKGLACGGSCVASNDVCRLKIGQIASPSEISRLNQSIVKFKLEQNQGAVPITTTQTVTQTTTTEDVPVKSKYIINPKTGIPYTIRELRKQASEKRIYGYGSMNIKELQGTLQLYDQKPESRDRITQGITRRKGFSTRALAASGLSGRGTPLERTTKRNLKNTGDTWRKLEALAKFASSSPVTWGAAAVGAFLLGQTIKNYETAKQSYREGFTESARIAEERASKLNIQHPVEKDGVATLLPNGKPRMSSRINQDNITFAVGSGEGYGAEQMKAMLQQEKDPTNTKDYWFTHSNYVVPFDLKEFGTPRPIGGGEPNIASTVINGVGGIVRNFTRKRNQDAVDLAAQIYAHAIAVSPSDGKTLVNRDKKINIVAHCNGGLVTKEALEIVSRMELKGSPTGKKVLERVNTVYLGTPHFGFAENVSRRQRTIVSPRDPISTLPVFGDGARQQWISSVSGGSASDYLKDERVRDSIREAFGYYQGSPEEVQRRVKKRGDSEEGRMSEVKSRRIDSDFPPSALCPLPSAFLVEKQLVHLDFAKRCKTGVPCGDICLPPGRKCRLSKSKYDPRKISARLGRGNISQTVGGLGQDLERAYLRSSRLVKIAQRKSNKKELPLTNKEKFKERLVHEGKLAGVLLGQGTISKTIKSVDEKLIDFSDFVSETPERVADAIAHIKEKLSNLIKKPTPET